MAFLAPIMLWGSLAASIPIALHFFFRSRYRTVPWAAMKFLLESIEQTSRRMKFQELLLLLLRVTLLVLLAVALARPLSSSVRGAGQGAAVHAVMLFDTSMSMGASDGGKTRLERAQDSALGILDQLPPHSTVQIITCADRADMNAASAVRESFAGPRSLGLQGPRIPENLDQARTIIRELKATSLATDLNDGITLAAAALEQENDNREFYIFTDMQKTAWETQPDRVRKSMENIGEKSSITVVRCGQQQVNNAAIVGIIPQTDVPRPGERVDFAVQVAHTSGKELRNLQLTLLIDGVKAEAQSRTIEVLEPKETKSVTITGKLDKPGLHTVTALLSKDDVPGDNRFDYVLRVPDYFRVLIVDGGVNDPDDQDRASLASSFYLMHQIVPVAEQDYGRYHVRQSRVRARMASPAQLGSPSKLDLCVLVNCEMPTADKKELSTRNVLSHGFLAELERFVKGGGSLLIYSGDRANNYQQYNKILGDQYGLLPLPLKGKAVDFPHEPLDKVVKVNRQSFDLPVFRKFKEDKKFEGFNDISIYKAFPVVEPQRKEYRPEMVQDKDKDRKPLTEAEKKAEEKKKAEDEANRLEQEKKAENVTVVLRYGNLWPAVISRLVGEGEVVFVTTSADPGGNSAQEIRSKGLENVQFTWNDWALTPMGEPFIKNTLAHFMARSAQQQNFEAGKPFVWIARDANRSYTLYHPKPQGKDEKRTLERLGTPVKDGNGKLTVKTAGTYQAGIYDIQSVNIKDEFKESEAEETRGEIAPVAVICDLSETRNLQTFKKDDGKESEFDAFLGLSSPVRHLLAGSGADRSTGADRFHREWTLWFLWALLILGLCEVALAWWCGRSW